MKFDSRTIRASVLALVSLTSSLATQAHPQAGAHQHLSLVEGLWHFITQPDHLALLAGASVVAFLIWRTRIDRSE